MMMWTLVAMVLGKSGLAGNGRSAGDDAPDELCAEPDSGGLLGALTEVTFMGVTGWDWRRAIMA